MSNDNHKSKVLVLSLLGLCWVVSIGLWVYSWNLEFKFDTRDLKEAQENIDKPWRQPARAMFAAIITVGGLSLSAFATWRAKDLLSDI